MSQSINHIIPWAHIRSEKKGKIRLQRNTVQRDEFRECRQFLS